MNDGPRNADMPVILHCRSSEIQHVIYINNDQLFPRLFPKTTNETFQNQFIGLKQHIHKHAKSLYVIRKVYVGILSWPYISGTVF